MRPGQSEQDYRHLQEPRSRRAAWLAGWCDERRERRAEERRGRRDGLSARQVRGKPLAGSFKAGLDVAD